MIHLNHFIKYIDGDKQFHSMARANLNKNKLFLTFAVHT